ncbi:uncharacterized protein MYCGRDRAFT_96183 [Zymoseptoria tritici IPO323]|uniref:Uncharacterized protein n=1 Tax=Zymoseptoria tritici (strain CBS 115943 / IPO323) TaxID=336722 RepID=F9XKN5_ZYMTI|nr:uncharacterized protein MYCGRDRAFT_96183 [Zymoseptoria tritici IPO323]EGP83821.1 hypothetical protein MYCGRDRAFT_96183 [Zymoseptoria tritici IPO323]
MDKSNSVIGNINPMPQPTAMSPPAAKPPPTTMLSPKVIPSPRSMPSPWDMPPANAVSPSKAMPSTSVMPPPSIMGPSKLPPFSQRKVSAARDDLMLQMNDPELDELIKELQNRQRKNRAIGTSNQNCGLLKLPAEILNYIYEDVAADAYGKAVTPHLTDEQGKKVRPSLLGTCYQIYQEFSGVMWSPKYMRAKMFGGQGQSLVVTEPRLLHAIVNELLSSLMFDTRRTHTTNPTEHCQEDVDRHLYQHANAWIGYITSQCPGAFEYWSKFQIHVANTESDLGKLSMKHRPGDFIRIQGLTFLIKDKDKRRVI